MSAGAAHLREVGELARQARELLGKVRDSRWPGFEPPPHRAPDSAAAPAAPRPLSLPRPPAPLGPAVPGSRRPPDGAAPGAALVTVQTEEPPPWNSLEQVAQAVSCCAKCPLHATRTRTVPGEGNPRPHLLFVGEAPGEEEDRLGRPFVGKAGQLLDKMIAGMGLARSQVFIANVLKCRPPRNRTPLPPEVAACLPYLRAQIELLAPQVICCLGKPATQALLGATDPIGRLRGRFFDYRGTPVMPTYHPSYLLRTPADKALAWKDLQQIMRRLGLPLPPPHPRDTPP